MTDDNFESKSNLKRTIVFCALTIGVAVLILYMIFSTEPTAERENSTLRRAMLVEVVEVSRGTFRPVIVETGTVAPAREVRLAPQVEGQVIELHPEFTPGGFLKKGEVVLRTEAADYENRLSQRESDLKQAETDLALEMGRQLVAKGDFELLGERLPEGGSNLVLREPQLAAAQVRVDAARAAVAQAKLDLERTELRSPFDAQILERMVNLGSQVSAGMPVAEIVGIDRYWVMATVAPSKLPFIQFPTSGQEGANVGLVKRISRNTVIQRTGRLYRLVGELEANTRMARVVIQVDDPLSRLPESADLPPLLVGEFLEVQIYGQALEDVVRLPISCLRKDDTTWVMSESGKLEIRELEIRFKDAEYVYVESGLDDGEQVITSSLSRVIEGADVRTETSAPLEED